MPEQGCGELKPSAKLLLVLRGPPPKLSRSEEARRVIEEYADSLREIIKTLHQRLN